MSIWGNNPGYLVAKCIYIDAERKADVVRQKGSQTDRQTDRQTNGYIFIKTVIVLLLTGELLF